MKTNNFKYHEATSVELIWHITSEIEDIMQDRFCLEHTDEDWFEVEKPVNYATDIENTTYRSLAGWLAYRSGIKVLQTEQHDADYTSEFNGIFNSPVSVMQQLLGYHYEYVFGQSYEHDYADRLQYLYRNEENILLNTIHIGE